MEGLSRICVAGYTLRRFIRQQDFAAECVEQYDLLAFLVEISIRSDEHLPLIVDVGPIGKHIALRILPTSSDRGGVRGNSAFFAVIGPEKWNAGKQDRVDALLNGQALLAREYTPIEVADVEIGDRLEKFQVPKT